MNFDSLKTCARGTLACLLCGSIALGQQAAVDLTNWASITAPVYGTSESGAYAGAELFAGPNKFGSYYAGVLPNGRKVTPAGTSIQVGMNPLGLVLTPDGKYAITSNDDERETGYTSLAGGPNLGGYSLTVVSTATLAVVSQINTGKYFIGLQATGSGPYTLWASGGADNDVKIFNISSTGAISADTNTPKIAITPILPSNAGYVSNYVPDPALNQADANGFKPPIPTNFDRVAGAQTTFPAGSALSPDGKFLYVACNGDNSVAVIDTAARALVKQLPVGYFPYTVAVSPSGNKIAVSNWGITEYKFAAPAYGPDGKLVSLGTTPDNLPQGFFVPPTSTTGKNPQTSSVSLLLAPAGNGAALTSTSAIYEGAPLDDTYQVGDTHPSATAIVTSGATEVLYVTKSNSDSLGLIVLNDNRKLPDFDLSPITVQQNVRPKIHGSYPNALAVSPDQTRLYVAEAGLNSVAVLDVSNPTAPKLLGRIPTGWYPTALAISPDGRTLYVANAKGIGEDINPNTSAQGQVPPPTGIASTSITDSNYIFGSLQQITLSTPDNTTVLANNFAIHPPTDTTVVPAGNLAPSPKITHVFFILHENKTFDSMVGNLSARFGNFASTTFNDAKGAPYTNGQYTGVSLNTQTLASQFATAVNFFADSEESDAGHQFAMSGTATDYTEKTLLVKSGRGLLVNKNFEPEDYPEAGYIFNNAARHGVSFKEYGVQIRISGTDTGTNTPTTLDDPASGLVGYPVLKSDKFSVTSPLQNAGDVSSETQGLGQTYFMTLPGLAIVGGNNLNGEPRIDPFYPGYNFNISDQRRAQEFIADFDGMVANNTLPQFLYIYQPNDHTGGVQAPNGSAVGTTALQQIADGDTGLGMVVNHILNSPVYYDSRTGAGSAIFVTYDDAQSSLDHIHPHRSLAFVISPYAKPGYTATRHYNLSSIVKTEELLLGLPPANLGDLFATDMRDMFQSTYNGISASSVKVTRPLYVPTKPGRRIWTLANRLDNSGPDRDSARLGMLTRLSKQADDLYKSASFLGRLSPRYRKQQSELMSAAEKVANAPHKDLDD